MNGDKKDKTKKLDLDDEKDIENLSGMQDEPNGDQVTDELSDEQVTDEPNGEDTKGQDYESRFTALTDKIEQLTNIITNIKQPVVDTEKVTNEPKEDEFLDGITEDDYINNPAKVSSLVAKRAYDKAMRDTTAMMDNVRSGNDIRNTFYGKYPEFKGLEAMAGAIGSQVEKEMQGRSSEVQLDEVAKRMHSIIDSSQKIYDKGRGGTPGQRKKQGIKVTPEEQEMNEVLSLAG